MRRLTGYIAILIFAFACKREVIINVQNHDAQMVVSGQLIPDSFLKLRLGTTQNITDNAGAYWLNNGFVEIYDSDTNLLEVLSQGHQGYYQAVTFKPKANTSYLFKLYGLNQTAWVDESVPDNIGLKLLDTTTRFFNDPLPHFQIKFELSQSNINAPAFYSIQLKHAFKKINGTDTQSVVQFEPIYSSDLVLTEDKRTGFSKQDLIFTNRIIKNYPQTLTVHSPINQLGQISTSVDLVVTRLSESAFNYYSTMYQHVFYQNNPFVEPNALMGNAVGAYGALLGVNPKQIHLDFK